MIIKKGLGVLVNKNCFVKKQKEEIIIEDNTKKELILFFNEQDKTLKFKIIIGKNSRLDLKLNQETNKELNIEKEIILKENSVLKMKDTMIKGKIYSEAKINMKENSILNLMNIHVTKESFDCDLILNVDEKNCKAEIESRTLVKDGKATIRGLINIFENSSNFEGFYAAKNIIVGTGKVASIPELDIKNPNVICGHSSTTETISEDELFYLQTRGFEKEKGKLLILEGLFGDDNIKVLK